MRSEPEKSEERDQREPASTLDEAAIGSLPSSHFHALAQLAASVAGTPAAFFCFAKREAFSIKGSVGTQLQEVGRGDPLLEAAMVARDFLLIENPAEDPKISGSELVGGNVFAFPVRTFAALSFSANVPGGVTQPSRQVTGVLCLAAGNSGMLQANIQESLRLIVNQCVESLELRLRQHVLEQKHASLELAFKNSEAFYHSLVETIPQNIFRKDCKGRFTFANSRFCEAVKRPLSEIIGKTDYELFPPELAAKYQQDDQRVLERKAPLKAIEQHRDTDGNTLYVQVIKSPLFGADGEISGVQGIFWDETERFQAEEALAYERDLLRAMLENVPDSIYFKDRNSRFLSVSRSLVAKLGLKDVEELIGKTDADFFTPAHAEQALQDEQTIVRTGEPLVAKMEREIWRDGKERWVLTTKVPLKNRQGEVTGTFGISKDVTDIKNAERQLAHARDMAIESARLKSEFLANMSHEIRTPLNAVIGITGLLLDTKLSEEQRDFAETIRKSADALLNIINDILDFSKIEAGKMAIETIDFELSEVVEGTAELLAESAQNKDVELASWIHDEVPRFLRGDPGRLRQVLTNLLGNAVKFTEKGEVVLDVQKVRETETHVLVRFSVRDTGIGVSVEAQPRLFEAFMQADGSTTRKYGGTGLGLAISKQLVDLMHGQIGFESSPGKGSTFWFDVPLEKQERQESRHSMASTLEGFRILVVDDNETNREIVHHQILSWKMRNGSAHSGKAALEMLEEAAKSGDPYHLAILDMQMPEMDGLTLARTIKSNPLVSKTQLVMLTSLGHLPEERRWRDAGISSYLVKPVKEHRLYDTLVTVLRGASQSGRKKTASSSGGAVERHSARILVAEDNIVNQKVALRQLQKLGYSADAVANGFEVLEAIKQVPYDVILMDCQMPELDGYEATRLIRSEENRSYPGKRLYIVAMTANALAGDREGCLTAGMDDYICKPVRIEELQTAVQRGIETVKSRSGDPDLLDLGVLDSVRELRSPGEPDPLAELVDLFLADTPPRIAKLLDAFKAGDPKEVETAAHGIKGSSSNLGARSLAGACMEVMNVARQNRLPDSTSIARVISEFDRLKPLLEKQKSI